MASIANDPNGRRRIQFVAPDGSRKTIRLGKCDRKSAEAIARHVEQLLAAKIGGQPIPRTTAHWLTEIGTELRDKLAAVGLADAVAKVPTLKAFLDEYLTGRAAELKPSTMTVLNQAARWLLRSLDGDKALDKFTPSDADKFRSSVLQGRAKATANKWTRYAREFFTAAYKRGLMPTNPFAHIKGLAVVGNPARRMFIPVAEIEKLMEAIPCPQFRLIVALARFGGLRCPSETLSLSWSDVNWEKDRLIVRASKTEHHSDGGVRVVPIFKELRPYLETVWENAEFGVSHVITRYRASNTNLRTQLVRWILQAGLEPWPKPFQNMRASRATELADQFPSHVSAKWLGHTEGIADEFYRSVTDEHYLRAIGGAGFRRSSGAKCGAATRRKNSHGSVGNDTNPCRARVCATLCD